MAREKLTELLTESICVTPEEATAALEARDWDVWKRRSCCSGRGAPQRYSSAANPNAACSHGSSESDNGSSPTTFHTRRLTIRRFDIVWEATLC